MSPPVGRGPISSGITGRQPRAFRGRGYRRACHERRDGSVGRARRSVLRRTLEVAAVVRPEAAAAIAELKKMGLRTIWLTGDAAQIAQDVGGRLAVDEVHAELMPDDKLVKVRALQEAGHQVAMVGDGVNDAPALAQAVW